jgi:hypothetical protein
MNGNESPQHKQLQLVGGGEFKSAWEMVLKPSRRGWKALCV